MTSLDEAATSLGDAELVDVLPATRWERFEELLARMSDHLNPILVKEARQALRSRQFTTTFFLMLAAGWTWSIMGLAMLGPAAYYNATGPSMFYFYYVILAAPLLIAIPYYAYQSLSSERQDRTYELVSITALDASGILVGKLCGIGMQMVVYLSALFPCLAFTYLLRGLDIFTVLLVVLYTCLLSQGLAMLGLLLATLTPSRGRHIVQGVALAIVLFYTFGMTVALMWALVSNAGIAIDDPNFWTVNLSMALFYTNAFALVFLAARALLTTAAQNRSTALRLALVVAQLSAIAWFGWASLTIDDDLLYFLIFMSTIIWYACGILMVGENGTLSPRIKRGLPKSLLGRVFLTWFTPGPGTGYMFVISNMIMLTVVATVMATPLFTEIGRVAVGSTPASVRTANNTPIEVFETCLVATSYLMIYLGLARLILSAARRFDEVKLSVRFLTGVLLVMVGGGLPWVVQITNPQTRNLDYTLMQTTNPLWTLWEYCTSNGPPSGMGAWLVTVLPLVALIIWGLNLPSLARELLQTHEAKPQRVAEEDVELYAARTTPQGPASPWD
jgi:hypothetical protein